MDFCTCKAMRLASRAREFPLPPALGVEVRVLRVCHPSPVCGVSREMERYAHRQEIELFFDTNKVDN